MNLDLFKNRGLNTMQLHQVKLGYDNGLTEEQIEIYAKPKFNWYQMEQIRLGLEAGMDVTIYAQENIPSEEMEHIRQKNEINADYQSKVKEETKLLKKENKTKSVILTLGSLGILFLLIVIALGALIGWNRIELMFDTIHLSLKTKEITVNYGESLNVMNLVDVFDERYVLKVTPENIDTSSVDTIDVIFQQTNGLNTKTEKCTVNVVDQLPPVLTLKETEIYEDSFAGCKTLIETAEDEVDGDLYEQVVCSDEYEFVDDVAVVNYSLKDAAGNEAKAQLTIKRVPLCGANATWDGSDCVCNDDYQGDAWNGCTAIPTKKPEINYGNVNNDSWNNSSNSSGTSGGNTWTESYVEEQWSDWEVVEEETWSSSSSSESSDEVIVEYE